MATNGTRQIAVGKDALDALYDRYNRRECAHPDPVEFLYDYEDPRDREIVGFLGASLAYGRVAMIMRSVASVLARMGDRPAGTSPSAFLMNASREELSRAFAGFRHRFATGEEVAALLWGLKRLMERHGSLNACFAAHLGASDETVVPALAPFSEELRDAAEGLNGHLLPCPARGSACKRLNLFLRWMVRRDAIDPGGWVGVSPAQLVVPLDTHMHRICGALGLTARSQADLRTALEVTDALRRFAPEDPVRYDFAISHLGIRGRVERARWVIRL